MELIIDHVSMKFRDKTAVDDATLSICSGVCGLLGANGAGKTTLMRMITGIIKPTSGQITYDGMLIERSKEKYRDILGYLPQEFGFPVEFSVKEYLEYVAALKGLTGNSVQRKIEELVTELSLTDACYKKIAKLSGGTKQRVGIAQALLNDPQILILDEPTSGLDPGERIRFRNMITKFAQNRVVIISTHIVSDVEYIATQNVIMKEGKIIAVGTTEELESKLEGEVWSVVIDKKQLSQIEKKTTIVNIKKCEKESLMVRYLAEKPIFENSDAVIPNLDDVFLKLFSEKGQL